MFLSVCSLMGGAVLASDFSQDPCAWLVVKSNQLLSPEAFADTNSLETLHPNHFLASLDSHGKTLSYALMVDGLARHLIGETGPNRDEAKMVLWRDVPSCNPKRFSEACIREMGEEFRTLPRATREFFVASASEPDSIAYPLFSEFLTLARMQELTAPQESADPLALTLLRGLPIPALNVLMPMEGELQKFALQQQQIPMDQPLLVITSHDDVPYQDLVRRRANLIRFSLLEEFSVLANDGSLAVDAPLVHYSGYLSDSAAHLTNGEALTLSQLMSLTLERTNSRVFHLRVALNASFDVRVRNPLRSAPSAAREHLVKSLTAEALLQYALEPEAWKRRWRTMGRRPQSSRPELVAKVQERLQSYALSLTAQMNLEDTFDRIVSEDPLECSFVFRRKGTGESIIIEFTRTRI